MKESVTVREMWPGGPLRQFSLTPVPNWIPYATGGYVGPYVCRRCRLASPKGLYDPEWLCSACKSQFTPKTTPKRHSPMQSDLVMAGCAA